MAHNADRATGPAAFGHGMGASIRDGGIAGTAGKRSKVRRIVPMTILIDQSQSMLAAEGAKSRFELVNDGVELALREFARQVGARVDPRIKVLGFNQNLYFRADAFTPIDRLIGDRRVPLTAGECRGQTFLWGAVNYALNDLLAEKDKTRNMYAGAPILVVFTDGKPEGDDPMSCDDLARGTRYRAVVQNGVTVSFITAGSNAALADIRRIASSVCRGEGEPDVFTCQDDFSNVVSTFKFLTSSVSASIGVFRASTMRRGGMGIR